MKKELRSLILEEFPLELRVQIELLSRRRDILNKQKQEELFKLLRANNIENITPLGPGTNRYAFKLKGFVIKVATDRDGKIDNLKEAKMAKRLFPDVTKVYEVSENGTLLVAEYIQPFQSFDEMMRYGSQIKSILKKISQVYLIGDVGLDAKNYANWGLRVGSSSPVCLDFAYVYDVKSEIFLCAECHSGAMLIPNEDYSGLICPNPLCGHKYDFEDIRGRISNEVHLKEIGDLSEETYRLYESGVTMELDPERSNYLRRLKIVDMKPESKKEEQEEFDNFIFNPKEENNMVIKAIATLANGMNVYPSSTPQEEDGVVFSGSMEDKPLVIQAQATLVNATSIQDIPTIETNKKTYDKPVSIPEATVKDIPVESIPKVIRLPKDEVAAHTISISELEALADAESESPDKAEETTPEVAPEEEAEVFTTAPQIQEEPAVEKVEEWHPSQAFKNGFNICISKIADRMQQSLYDMQVFEDVRDQYMPPSKKPIIYGAFYTAVKRSAAYALDRFFDAKPVKNDEGRTIWMCQKFEGTDYEPSLIFLDRWYSKRYINDAETPQIGMDKYRETYTDYLGLQRGWLATFEEKLGKEMNIDRDGLDYVAELLAGIWCVPLEVEDIVSDEQADETNEPPKLVFEEKVEQAVKHLEETGQIEVVDDMIYPASKDTDNEHFESDEDMIAFSGDILNKIDAQSPDLSYITDEDEDDEEIDEMDEELNDLEVRIYPGAKYDIIRVLSSDSYGNIEIPLYKKLADVDPVEQDIPSLADSRNGDWDWLIHMTPDLRFLTDNPDEWLALNNDDEVSDTVKFMILDPECDGKTMIGMYALAGIFTYNEDGECSLESDSETLKRLNILIKSEIGNSSISYYSRALTDEDLIRTEEYARAILSGLPTDASEETTVSEVVDAVDDSNELGVMEPIRRKYN